jgi:hypothetical protein
MPEIRARNNRKRRARSVFYVVRAVPSDRQQSCKHTSLIEEMFSMLSAPRLFARQLRSNAPIQH